MNIGALILRGFFGKAAVGAGVVAGVGAAATGLSEVRHRRGLSRDGQWRQLKTPLAGSVVGGVVSADGTTIHLELFGVGARAGGR